MPPNVIGAEPLSVIPHCLRRGGFIQLGFSVGRAANSHQRYSDRGWPPHSGFSVDRLRIMSANEWENFTLE
jgi:hypothetical protein